MVSKLLVQVPGLAWRRSGKVLRERRGSRALVVGVVTRGLMRRVRVPGPIVVLQPLLRGLQVLLRVFGPDKDLDDGG